MIVFNTAGGLADASGQSEARPDCSNQLSVTHGVAVSYNVLVWFYEIMQATLLVWSLGNKPDESELLWNVVAYSLGLYNIGTIAMVLWVAPQFSFTVLISGIGEMVHVWQKRPG